MAYAGPAPEAAAGPEAWLAERMIFHDDPEQTFESFEANRGDASIWSGSTGCPTAAC